ncbi:MAG: DUF6106 family protein [Lachnospiraceae bacterium]|nr:DUF6106 family protein [Lachnospiraceae bacterium]
MMFMDPSSAQLDNQMMEVLVKKEQTNGQKMGRFFLIWLDFMMFFYGFYIYFCGAGLGLVLVLVAIGLFILNRMVIFPRLSLEYEYIYYNKTISIDVIYGQRSRKNVGEYSLEKMEILAPVSSHQLDSFNHRTFVVKDCWSGIPLLPGEERERKPYVMIYDGKQKLLLDLPEDFVKMVHNNAPRKVYFD